METIRVDITYRPIRVAWVIEADIDEFREAATLSSTLWGGHFNPIVIAKNAEEAGLLIDLFRVDMIYPISDSEPAMQIQEGFSHLIRPYFHNQLHFDGPYESKISQLLNLQNQVAYLSQTLDWARLRKGIKIYNWQKDDPLGNIFLVQLGRYPSAEEIGIDYLSILTSAFETSNVDIEPYGSIPPDILEYANISDIGQYGLKRRIGAIGGWASPGFFVGNSTDVNDLISYWNLRAAGIPVLFVDPNHIDRYDALIPAWEKRMRKIVSTRHEFDRHIALWSRGEDFDEARKLFGNVKLTTCRLSMHSWNGRNISPSFVFFDRVSTLGMIGRERDRPRVSFELNNKPFCGDPQFHNQHLAASISFLGSLYQEHQFTLTPPFIPELNEFYSRKMHFQYNKLRI